MNESIQLSNPTKTALGSDIVASECASGSSTLTTEGCSGCDDYDLCLGFTSKSSCSGSGCVTEGDCTYECLAVDESSTTLIVLVIFGDYESEEEIAAGAAGDYDNAELSSSGYADYMSTCVALRGSEGRWQRWKSLEVERERPRICSASRSEVGSTKLSSSSLFAEAFTEASTTTWSWVSNNQVTTIDTANLSSSVTTLPHLIGHVRHSSCAAQFESGNQVDSLPDLLQSSVKTFNIGNALLQSFPTVLSGITSLQELYMDMNYVTSVNFSEVIDALIYLSMQQNNLDSFTAAFPNLECLYLNDNNFTSVPAAIYQQTKLTELYLTGNSFASMRFMQAEIDFLDNLTVLGLESTDFSVELHCDESKKTVVHNVTVCLSAESDADTGSSSSANSGGSSGTTSTSSPDSSSSISVGAIIGIMCAVVVVFVVGIGLFFYCRRQKSAQRDKLMETNELAGNYITSDVDGGDRGHTYAGSIVSGVSMGIPTGGSGGNPAKSEFMSLWNDPDLLSVQVRAEDIEDIRQLGSGAYATVWLIQYRKSQLFASKRLRHEMRSKQRTLAFVEEFKLVANFDHPNLVKFIGAAWTIESDLQALLEYMDGGDLREYLANSNTPLSWTPQKFGIAIGVIEALVYLHSFIPPLVHRDLKSRNVLLSAGLQPKLSDFGTSRFRSEENTMTAGVGTGRWLAPEVITGDSNYGPAADIYSFGVLLTELDTNDIPYSSARGANGQALSDMAILHQVATAQLRPVVGNDCSPELRDLVDRCLMHDSSKRPTATIIAYELRRMREDVVGRK